MCLFSMNIDIKYETNTMEIYDFSALHTLFNVQIIAEANVM